MSHPSLSDDYGFSLLLKTAEFMDGNINVDQMWNWLQAPIETSAPVDDLPPTQPISPDALTSPSTIPPPPSSIPTSLPPTATGRYMTRRRSRMVNSLDDIPRETADAKQPETSPARARPSKPKRRGSRVDHSLQNTAAKTDTAKEPSSGPRRTSSTKLRDGSRASSSANNRKANPVKGRERWHCYFPGCTATIYPRRHDIDRHIQVHLNPEDRPYHCTMPGCGFSTVQRGNLRTHLNTHKGACTSCDEVLDDGTPCVFKCNDSGQMTRHKQKMHGWPNRESSTRHSTPYVQRFSLSSTPSLAFTELTDTSRSSLESPLSSPPDSPRQRASAKQLEYTEPERPVIPQDGFDALVAPPDTTPVPVFRMPESA